MRARVETLLQRHDDLTAIDAVADVDYPMVRLLAQESAAFGGNPALRYSAIAALATAGTAADVNLLTDLARFGEDFYVRAHALLGLGNLGSYAHLPVLIAALDAAEPLEQAAATSALVAISRQARPGALDAHAVAVGGAALAERIGTVLAAAAEIKARKPESRSTTASDD